jgi:hypothetical protein
MRDIQAPPPHLYTLLVEVGPSTLVLVEGGDDRYILNEWYPEGDHNILYHVPSGGKPGVERLLDEVLTQTSLRRAFGLIDRDYRSQAEVDQRLSNPDEHLFIWPRYELENYLLLPKAIREELHVYYRGKATTPTEAEIENKLFSLCQQLCPLMAANWACLDARAEYFREGFPLDNRTNLIHVTAAKLACSEAEAEQRIAAKEALLLPMMASLEQAHCGIKGKHLLYQLHALYVSQVTGVGGGLSREYLKSLLARAVKRLGLSEDIKTIIEQRVLA